MKVLDNFTIELTCVKDLDCLVASPKNRSSFYSVDDGIRAGNHPFAAKHGQMRAKKWANYLETNQFSPLAILPVWDNSDGTFTLGDGHTRVEALKALAREGKLKHFPGITLTIRNHKYSSFDEFTKDTSALNAFPGYKWDVMDKLDYLAKENNANALHIIKRYDESAALRQEGFDKCIPMNVILTVELDQQGTTKVSHIEQDLPRIVEFNPYATAFYHALGRLNEAIKASSRPKSEMVNMWNEKCLLALYHIFMCAALLDKEEDCTIYTELYDYLIAKFFTTDASSSLARMGRLNVSDMWISILEHFQSHISDTPKKMPGCATDVQKFKNQLELVKASGKRLRIDKRGGRQIKIRK